MHMERDTVNQKEIHRLFRIALALAVATIGYNLLEGAVSLYFGFSDESLALFGFGVDSFIEVLSGFGIAHMMLRIRRQPDAPRDNFERTALTITGIAFYILVVGLCLTSLYNLWTQHAPVTTVWGVIISCISILFMWILVYKKRMVGVQLQSNAILADAECTKVCIYMSIVLLVSSGVYELTRLSFIDPLGTLGLAYLSWKEGRECFEKAKGKHSCVCGNEQ